MIYKKHSIFGKNLSLAEIENCLKFISQYIDFLKVQRYILRLQKRRLAPRKPKSTSKRNT